MRRRERMGLVGDRPARYARGMARIDIDRISLEGDGVADLDGLEVRTPGLFVGERAEVEVVHRSRQHRRAFARAVAVERPHPARREAPCPMHERAGGGCSGCPLMELDEDAQREAKRRMLAELGLQVERIEAGPPLGYRASSKRVAFGAPGALRLGSFTRGTHEGADMRGCLVDHPRITEAADELAREANGANIAPFDEASGEGDLRYVWFKTDGERVLATLITANEDSRAAQVLPGRLPGVDGVAWSVQGGRGNAIRGSTPRVLRGIGGLSITLAGVQLEAGPLGFLQPNPEVIARAYQALVSDGEAPLAGRRALDLYAGAGVTTVLLRRAFDEVVPCESYPESAAALGVAPMEVEPFLAAQNTTTQNTTPDLIVANPPRKGLGDAVCDALLRIGAPRVHIMSCGPVGLARDLARLQRGGYTLTSLEAYDTLPQTAHVELVARLRKA